MLLFWWSLPLTGQLTEIGGDDFLVHADSKGHDSAQPVMARDSVNGQVLVVWLQQVTLDKTGFEIEVFGKLYHDDGSVAKEAFAVSETGVPGRAGGPSHVAVTFNPKSGNFLVVWAALDLDFGIKDTVIIGRELDEGEFDGPETILRHESNVDLAYPAVGCDPLTGNYLLAWRRGDTVQHLVLDRDLGLEEGTEDTIDLPATRVEEDFRAPSVTFQSAGGDFLVAAIVDDAGSGTELQGRVIEPFTLGSNPLTLLAPGAGHYAITAGARNSSGRYCVVYRDPRLKAVLLDVGLGQVDVPFEVAAGEVTQLPRALATTFDRDSQLYYATWLDKVSPNDYRLTITGWDREGTISLPSQALGQTFATADSATINHFPVALMVPRELTQDLWLAWPTSQEQVRILAQRAAALEVDIQVTESVQGLAIPSGSDVPTEELGTAFGIQDSIVTRTFIITNNGLAPLELTGSPIVELSGIARFSIVSQPGETLLYPGESTSFEVQFEPGSTRYTSAEIEIAYNDPSESPFTFVVDGTSENQFDVAASTAGGDGRVASACVPRDGSVFVVWNDEDPSGNPGEGEILGRLVGADETLLTPVFKVSTNGDTTAGTQEAPAHPAIATNGLGCYLVVWAASDSDVSPHPQIIGQLYNVAGDGSDPVPVGDNFQISADAPAGNAAQREVGSPAVEYDSLNKRFWVAWHADDQGFGAGDDRFEIYATALNAEDGSKALADMRISEADSRSANALYPDLCFDCENQRFLIVWQEIPDNSDPAEVWGQGKTFNGIDAFRGDFEITDSVDTQFAAGRPSSAFQPSVGQYLIVWAEAENQARMGQYLLKTNLSASGNNWAFTPVNHLEDDEPQIIARGAENSYEIFYRNSLSTENFEPELFSVVVGPFRHLLRSPKQVSATGGTVNLGYTLSRCAGSGDTFYSWFSQSALQGGFDDSFSLPSASFKIKFKGHEIADGDNTPSVGDNTQFPTRFTDEQPVVNRFFLECTIGRMEIFDIIFQDGSVFSAEAPQKSVLHRFDSVAIDLVLMTPNVSETFTDVVTFRTSG